MIDLSMRLRAREVAFLKEKHTFFESAQKTFVPRPFCSLCEHSDIPQGGCMFAQILDRGAEQKFLCTLLARRR